MVAAIDKHAAYKTNVVCKSRGLVWKWLEWSGDFAPRVSP